MPFLQKNKSKLTVITGAAGFIGSCLLAHLNEQGENALVIVDDFSIKAKKNNWNNKKYVSQVDRKDFLNWLRTNHSDIKVIYHLGARTDTTEFDWSIFEQLNVNYTKSLWRACAKYEIPLLYASSAATYGLGEYGYEDNHEIVEKLQPLNPYGRSKNDFDKWALQQQKQPPAWYGVKFFNVYGPNEYHKGRMASVVFHFFRQIQTTGKVKLFKSHHSDFEDGKQQRDFIYVKDVIQICHFLLTSQPASGLYNVGTGQATTFLDLAKATFEALQKKSENNIHFIDTPLDIRDKYQYFTQANITKLKKVNYISQFFNIQKGVADYVNYLKTSTFF